MDMQLLRTMDLKLVCIFITHKSESPNKRDL